MIKHIFVFNPAAGSGKINKSIIDEKLKGIDVDYEIYETTSVGDTQRFVKEKIKCRRDPDEVYRFYACGGDGTLKDVAEGIYGEGNVEASVFPIGSGNDFVKYYGGAEGFLDLPLSVKSVAKPVDLIKVGDRYSINVTNFGFDADACATMIGIKRKPIIGGSNSYYTGVVKAIFTSMKNSALIYADGKLLNPEGKFCLCAVCNASYVGGGFCCGPKAVSNDGLLDVVQIKPVSLFTFARMIGSYKNGTYMDNRNFDNIYRYTRARKIRVESDKEFNMCLDGDIIRGKSFDIEVVRNAIMFASPYCPSKNEINESADDTIKI